MAKDAVLDFGTYLRRHDRRNAPFLFVITHARSGSTLLQALLNRIPGYCIRGENGNALFHLYRAHAAVETARRVWHSGNVASHPWYGASELSPVSFSERLIDAFFEDVLKVPAGTTCCGFKEVRHTVNHMPKDEFRGYIEFLERNFPNCRFVANVRAPADAARSAEWAKAPQEPLVKMLEQTRVRLEALAASRDTVCLFDYDAWIKDPDYAKELFEFLGEKYDPEMVRAVLSVKQGI